MAKANTSPESASAKTKDRAEEQAQQQYESICAMVEAFNASDEQDQEAARETIYGSVLSVEVRSDWHSPTSDPMPPMEYLLLLCTGGPAVRLTGELDEHGEPVSAMLEHQDWFRPWEEYSDTVEDVLLAYARCFHFGD